MERMDSRFREPVGVRVGQSVFDQPPPPSGAEWLTEFLRREGLIEFPRLAGHDLPGREPVRQSYGRTRETVRAVAIGGGALLVAGLLAGAVAYHDATRSEPVRPLPLQAVAVASPIVAHPPRKPAPPPSIAASIGGGDPAAFYDFPRQPVYSPPPALAPDDHGWNHPRPESGVEIAGLGQDPFSVRSDLAPSDWAASPILPKTPAQTPAVIATAPRRDGLNLRVVHAPSGPAEASRIDALIGGLRSQIGDITGATVTSGPASPEILVLYFSPADHANARRIAASLGRATRQPYQVKQGHADPLPEQGTVEIQLP